jgi:hypothetical protein
VCVLILCRTILLILLPVFFLVNTKTKIKLVNKNAKLRLFRVYQKIQQLPPNSWQKICNILCCHIEMVSNIKWDPYNTRSLYSTSCSKIIWVYRNNQILCIWQLSYGVTHSPLLSKTVFILNNNDVFLKLAICVLAITPLG